MNLADNIKIDIENNLHIRVNETFLMPNHFKNMILSSPMHDELANVLEEFFNDFGSLEENILHALNDEFPVITKQMMKHIENISTKEDIEELDLISQNIHLFS